MKNKKTIKNIIFGLIIAICALIIYSALSGKESSSSQTGSSSSLSSLIGSGSFGQIQETDTDLANAEILRILGNIQNIELNDDIFQNPVFRELEDSRFTIPKPVRIGRPNPFRPIGFDTVEIVGDGLGSDTSVLDDGGTGFFEETI
ncbi:hypothetical protein KC866_01585 [Patescibacteria group bacterium]|nr:hypothetical protein [Patescibacteria group bacterium]